MTPPIEEIDLNPRGKARGSGLLLFCGSAFLALSCGFLFFHRLGERDLWSSHEARAGMDAQSMLDDGDWLVPKLFDGQPELQKPPLYYWLVAGIGGLRGGEVDALAVRLPSAWAAAGCVALLVWFGASRNRPVAGLLAGTILATVVHFTWMARIGRIDVPLALCVATAVIAWHGGTQNAWFYLLGFLAVAAGVMLKGPIAVVLPTAIIGLKWMADRLVAVDVGHERARPWLRTLPLGPLPWGVPLVLMLTLPWFFWANERTGGELFRVFVWHHNFERGFGGSNLRGHSWWFYGPQFLAEFLPWSPFVLAASIWSWRRGWWRTDADLRFGLIWLAAVVGVLSCFRFKRADYLLPAYPGVAWFLGCAGERLLVQSRAGGRRWLLGLAGTIFLATATGWAWKVERGLPQEEPEREYRTFAGLIRGEARAPALVLFFRTEAHPLAFRVGRPLSLVLEWDDLRESLTRQTRAFVVMPAVWLKETPRQLPGLDLEELGRHGHLAGPPRERPLVLVRITKKG